MRIGITQRVVHNPSYVDVRDALSQDWVQFLEATLPGSVVVPVPNALGDVPAWLGAVQPDAVILSSGNDLDAEPGRDRCEWEITRWSLESGVPLLGVCRGLQVVNRYFGGDLTLNLRQETGVNHVNCEHDIQLSHPGFDSLAGRSSATLRVNSYHDHGVRMDGLATSLTVFAATGEGVVEGVVHDAKPLMAIQWHPERQSTDQAFSEALVRKFLVEGLFWWRPERTT